MYAPTETRLNDEYYQFKNDLIVAKYSNFSAHIENYWGRKTEWAVCYRNTSFFRGIDTNNYAKFFELYLGTVKSLEPDTCATQQLATMLHTYFKKQAPTKVTGIRNISVQPTAISRRKGTSKGSKLALCGRPARMNKDENTQTRRGRQEHTKRKQNLRQNELKNQPNQFKHGHGH